MPSDPPPARRRVPRALPLLLALLVALTALSGCARVRAALAVQPDDTVNGEIVVATPERGADDPGAVITLPEDLEDEVEVSEYRQEGYAGSLLRFSGLTFEQVAELTGVGGPTTGTTTFALRRAGNRVLVSGQVDLTTVAVDRADFQLKISSPGEVIETNGDAEGGTAGWTFDPGEVNEISAVVAFTDPNAPSVLNWTLLLGLFVAAASAAVVVLARRTRNPPVSPRIR